MTLEPTVVLPPPALLEGLPDTVVVADAEGRVAYVNAAVRTLLGHDPAALLGRPLEVLMPEADATVLDVRTSRVPERIAAVDDFVAAGYEVHLNLSPVVLRDGWEADWAQLLRQLDDTLSPAAKAQAAAEVILMTHNRDLHHVNLGWHPQAEELLWRPEMQQPKRSQNGQWNVRYRNDVKRAGVERLQELVAAHAPWLRIRYAF